MENLLNHMRDKTIRVFEYVVLISMFISIAVCVLLGAAHIIIPHYGGLFTGLLAMVGGTIGSLAAGGGAFILAGIYHNTKKD
jgi:hypothetical protein